MKIEIAEPGRMTQTGSSLLKLIQNNDMPILDLLVRESVQNSLDAGNDKDDYVTVEFKTGVFSAKKLNNELEGITGSLNKRYCKSEYEYMAISDSNTVGLTGRLHYDEVTDNNYGNLLKLIYEISKPQDAEGAGGSWGLGKTVYFRVGIGLVLYYSRIKNENNQYESRLAASLVEDENKNDSLIPELNGKYKRGIAWWGEEVGKNKTQPVVDESYINKILNIFNVMPYEGYETGTTIIIPYIDSYKLLSNNQADYNDSEGNSIKPFWKSNLDDYLRIAIQRWYAPRLNNILYPYGKYLRAKVNSQGIAKNEIEPIFQIIQGLYNRAVEKKSDYKDILERTETKQENITLRKVLIKSEAGVVSYARVSRETLKMNYPDNKPSPFIYLNYENFQDEKNKPIITFTRKPGMIVSYENAGTWVDGISSTDKDKFIVGIFVLNSSNNLSDGTTGYSLEEYVRKSEMADHTSWNDFSFQNYNPRIISKIQGHVKTKVSKQFENDEQEDIRKLNSGLGKIFGDLLLPPENFGKRPSAGQNKKSKDKQHIERHKDIIFTVDKNNIKYTKDGIEVKMRIKTRKKIKNASLILGIDAEGGSISFKDWEEKMGMKLPFNVKGLEICLNEYDNMKKEENDIRILSSDTCELLSKNLKIQLLKSKSDFYYGFKITSDEMCTYEVECRLKVHMFRRDLKPVFNIEMNERDT